MAEVDQMQSTSTMEVLEKNGVVVVGETGACKTKNKCFDFIAEKFPKWSEDDVSSHVHQCDDCICEE